MEIIQDPKNWGADKTSHDPFGVSPLGFWLDSFLTWTNLKALLFFFFLYFVFCPQIQFKPLSLSHSLLFPFRFLFVCLRLSLLVAVKIYQIQHYISQFLHPVHFNQTPLKKPKKTNPLHCPALKAWTFRSGHAQPPAPPRLHSGHHQMAQQGNAPDALCFLAPRIKLYCNVVLLLSFGEMSVCLLLFWEVGFGVLVVWWIGFWCFGCLMNWVLVVL